MSIRGETRRGQRILWFGRRRVESVARTVVEGRGVCRNGSVGEGIAGGEWCSVSVCTQACVSGSGRSGQGIEGTAMANPLTACRSGSRGRSRGRAVVQLARLRTVVPLAALRIIVAVFALPVRCGQEQRA